MGQSLFGGKKISLFKSFIKRRNKVFYFIFERPISVSVDKFEEVVAECLIEQWQLINVRTRLFVFFVEIFKRE